MYLHLTHVLISANSMTFCILHTLSHIITYFIVRITLYFQPL